GVSWLVGFVPYWSEALLVVPREGAPYLVVALSFRVKSWIERTSRIGEVVHTPRIGLKAAQRIAATRPDAAVGIVDFDGLPAGIADDLREGGPGAALGKTFALRATVAYKGTWVRLVRCVCQHSIAQEAAARLAQAVASLPSDRGFSGFRSWLVEGARMAQPLDPLIGSRLNAAKPPPPGALVSVQGMLMIDGRTVLVGAPALIGQSGETASLIVDPLFD